MATFYQTHRPPTLEKVAGNQEEIAALQKALGDLKKAPRTYLLTGPTGCGKTTIARIMQSMVGVADIDFKEINSSNFNGVDAVRGIIRDVGLSPMGGKYKMYLMDEVHQLTGNAQDAFLKTLEDTPSHVFFVMCTTDPQKLKKAFIGRCTKVLLNPLKDDEMTKLLKGIAKKEKGKIEKDVLEQIVDSTNGLPRDAIQLLEKVLHLPSDERMKAAKEAEIVETASIDLCKQLLSPSSWKSVQAILKELKGQDAEGIRRHVIAFASGALMRYDSPQAGLVLQEFIEPFYNSGFPGLVFACYTVVKSQ